MKIAHVCLTGPFNDGWAYQENMLARQHRLAGHDVMILATPYATDTNTGRFIWQGIGSYFDSDGVCVVRLAPTAGVFRRRWSRFNTYRGVRRQLERFAPDVVFVHGCQCLDVLTVVRFCRAHSSVKVYVDNHADWFNSATNWVSRTILHGLLWRYCAQKIEPYTTRYWGVTEGCCRFLTEIYGISPTKVGLLPLGAEFDEMAEPERSLVRNEVRARLGVTPQDFLVVTGGKIDASKNVHLLMRAMSRLAVPNVKLLIFGSVLQDVRDEFFRLLESPAIRYVGWASPEDIKRYLVSAELAVFPGSQSALWNQVVGSGVPALFRSWEGGTSVDIGGNCLLLQHGDEVELTTVLQRVLEDRQLYRRMRSAASGDGRLRFSYSQIAKASIGDQ